MACVRPRPTPPRVAPTDRTGRSPQADRPSAERSWAAAETPAASRADSRRRSSCRHRSPTGRSAHGLAAPTTSDRPPWPPRLALRGRAEGPQTTGQRLRWSRFQPAQEIQYSPGADNDIRRRVQLLSGRSANRTCSRPRACGAHAVKSRCTTPGQCLACGSARRGPAATRACRHLSPEIELCNRTQHEPRNLGDETSMRRSQQPSPALEMLPMTAGGFGVSLRFRHRSVPPLAPACSMGLMQRCGPGIHGRQDTRLSRC